LLPKKLPSATEPVHFRFLSIELARFSVSIETPNQILDERRSRSTSYCIGVIFFQAVATNPGAHGSDSNELQADVGALGYISSGRCACSELNTAKWQASGGVW
jgi:hypothetical protein